MEAHSTQQALPVSAWDHETQKRIAHEDAASGFEALQLADAMRSALAAESDA